MTGTAVDVRFDAATGVAHFAGVQSCGNAWCCPVCAPKVRGLKAVEVEEGLLRHWKMGGSASFVTFKLRHGKSDKLRWLLDALQESLRKLRSGRRWQDWKTRMGIVGVIVAREVTYGENGWHPHAHSVLLYDRTHSADELAAFEGELREAWHALVRQATGRRLTKAQGMDMRPVDRGKDGLAGYLVKVGSAGLGGELLRGDFKTGRRGSQTPAEILSELLATGDVAALDLWREYEQATRKLPVLTWSKGLRGYLGLVVVEMSDEELAALEVGGDTVKTLDAELWRQLLCRRMTVALLEEVERAGGWPESRVVAWLFWLPPGTPRPS